MKYTKRIAAGVLVLVLMLSCVTIPRAEAVGVGIADGTCGNGLTWNLYSDGMMIILGSGEMKFSAFEAPWAAYRDRITHVVIKKSVTSIADDAFSECRNLTTVELPNTLTKIGMNAFYNCTGLTTITLPNSLTTIGVRAFENCDGLPGITIPAGVTTIQGNPFNWSSLPEGIQVAAGNPNYCAEDGVLFNKDKTRLICMPAAREGSYSVPDTVDIIGAYAFADSELSQILLPEGLLTIQSNAFDACNQVTQMDIPGSVTSIAPGVFGMMQLQGIWVEDDNTTYSSDAQGVLFNKFKTTLQQAPQALSGSYTIPDSVTRIEDYAFRSCQNLTGISIPHGVTQIGLNAFEGCRGLQEITVPAGVSQIPWAAFSGLKNGAAVRFVGDAPVFDSGAFGRSTVTCYYPANNPTWTEAKRQNYGGTITWVAERVPVIIVQGTCGAGLTWKLDDAGLLTISGSGKMTDFSVNDAPWYPYRNSILSVVIEEGVTSVGSYAFRNAENMTSVQLPESLQVLGNSAFYSCENLQSIHLPEGLTTIYGYAFTGCSALNTIHIPASVTKIGDNPFVYLDLPGGIWVDANNPNYSSDGYGVLFNKDKTELIKAPSAMEGSYTVPATVKTLGYGAFANTRLSQIHLPEGLQTISYYVFSRAYQLKELQLPQSLRVIEHDAFDNCDSITELHIPAAVTTIEESCFDMNGLQKFTVDAENQYFCADEHGVLFNKDKTVLVRAPRKLSGAYRIPDTVIKIGREAFYFVDGLKQLWIPEGVETIDWQGFSSCNGLSEIVIPSTVTYLENFALGFLRYNHIAVRFVGNAPKMNSSAFSGSKMTCYYPADNPTWTASVRQNYGGTITWVAYTPIPETAGGQCGEKAFWSLDGDGVLRIAGIGETYDYDYLEAPWMEHAGQITSVVVESGITGIGSYAFSNCTALENAALPVSLLRIGDYAFAKCSALEEVAIPGNVTTIGEYAFSYCESLAEILIPDSVTSLGSYAFENCTGAQSITIGRGITQIPAHAFDDCRKVTAIEIPEGVTSIGNGSFFACYALTDLTIPNTVTEIGSAAFSMCFRLETVTIPASVTRIGDSAFSENGLREIRFMGNAPAFGGNYVFENVSATAYYPAGNPTWTEDVMKQYKGTITWKPYCYDAHTLEIRDAREASCLEDGYTGDSFCALCGELLQQGQGIPAPGHSYEKGVCTACGAEDPDYILVGDSDGDGEVTDWDAILLSRYLSGWAIEIDLETMDLDGDGEITDWDAILLDRYLAGWNIVLQ